MAEPTNERARRAVQRTFSQLRDDSRRAFSKVLDKYADRLLVEGVARYEKFIGLTPDEIEQAWNEQLMAQDEIDSVRTMYEVLSDLHNELVRPHTYERMFDSLDDVMHYLDDETKEGVVYLRHQAFVLVPFDPFLINSRYVYLGTAYSRADGMYRFDWNERVDERFLMHPQDHVLRIRK